MSETTLLTTPTRIPTLDECHFYHTMEIPGHGVVKGVWDLRSGVDDYLGNVSFANQRVLEIGPASGFLTFEMEKRGAQVVSVEVTEDSCWDFVPYPAARLQEVLEPRREVMGRLKNSYWLAHSAHKSKAQVYYGDVYHLPVQLGEFDIALMGSVLLHLHSPVQILSQCARMARKIIITEKFYPELEGKPICRLVPTRDNFKWHTWWNFSTTFFIEFLAVMGFPTATTTTHTQYHQGTAHKLFTIVATR